MPYLEKDVSVDPAAAQEMMRRSRQRGVPVITVGDDVIVGFDRQRLEQALAKGGGQAGGAARPRLGAAVADAETHGPRHMPGAYVGRVTPGTPAAQAGLAEGDVITAVDGQPVRNAHDVERIRGRLRPGSTSTVEIVRDGRPHRIPLRL